MAEEWLTVDGRVTRVQIAKMFDAAVGSVDNWTRRYPDFPKPDGEGRFGRAEVATWHAQKWPGGDKMYRLRRGSRVGTAYLDALETIRGLAYQFGHDSAVEAGVQHLLTQIIDTANAAINDPEQRSR